MGLFLVVVVGLGESGCGWVYLLLLCCCSCGEGEEGWLGMEAVHGGGLLAEEVGAGSGGRGGYFEGVWEVGRLACWRGEFG